MKRWNRAEKIDLKKEEKKRRKQGENRKLSYNKEKQFMNVDLFDKRTSFECKNKKIYPGKDVYHEKTI